jgi:hypothetical protein
MTFRIDDYLERKSTKFFTFEAYAGYSRAFYAALLPAAYYSCILIAKNIFLLSSLLPLHKIICNIVSALRNADIILVPIITE